MLSVYNSHRQNDKREPTISVSLLKTNIRVYETLYQPYDYAFLEQTFGITNQILADEDNRVPLRITNDLIQRLSQAMRDPLLGLNWHRHAAPPIRQAILRCLSNAPDINTALQIALRYVHLITEMGDFELKTEKETGRLLFFPFNEDLVTYHQIDAMLLGIVHLTDKLGGEGFTSVALPHACPPGCEEAYRQAFQRPVSFEQPHSMLTFSSPWLKETIGSDKISLDDLVSSEKKRADVIPGLSFPTQVESTIKPILIFGEPGREYVAQAWGMSLRSFQRKLVEAGTTYQKLLNKIRLEQAINYLSQPIFSCEEVAFLLGYSEARPFYHAFKRWTGLTPSKYRQSSLSNCQLIP